MFYPFTGCTAERYGQPATASPRKNQNNAPASESDTQQAAATFEDTFTDAINGIGKMLLALGSGSCKSLADACTQQKLQEETQAPLTPRKRGRRKLEISPVKQPCSNGVMNLQDYINELAKTDETQTIYNQLRQDEYNFCESEMYAEQPEQLAPGMPYRRCESTNNVILPVDLSNPFFFSLCNTHQNDGDCSPQAADSPEFMGCSGMSSQTTVYKNPPEQADSNWFHLHEEDDDYPSLARFMKPSAEENHQYMQHPLRLRVELGDLTNFY